MWLDVIPREKQKDFLSRILSASDAAFKMEAHLPPMSMASYYFRFYLARALDHAGLADRYLELLQPWRGMIALGLTTWAEVPEPTRSDSHAWSSHPNYDFLTLVAGIRPSGFGFNEVTIEPHLGSLKRVAADFPHRAGLIRAQYTSHDKNVKAHIELPSGLTGKLIWNGHDYPLHEGTQELSLNPKARIATAYRCAERTATPYLGKVADCFVPPSRTSIIGEGRATVCWRLREIDQDVNDSWPP